MTEQELSKYAGERFADIIHELHELRAMRDRMQRESNAALQDVRFMAEAGDALNQKYPGTLKSACRKLLEESAELLSECSNEWAMKQRGTDAAKKEIGDVFLVLNRIARTLGTTPIACAREKFQEVMKRP